LKRISKRILLRVSFTSFFFSWRHLSSNFSLVSKVSYSVRIHTFFYQLRYIFLSLSLSSLETTTNVLYSFYPLIVMFGRKTQKFSLFFLPSPRSVWQEGPKFLCSFYLLTVLFSRKAQNVPCFFYLLIVLFGRKAQNVLCSVYLVEIIE
jgi:hypothetical protein